ncbi:hypothetical protein LR48_Vigan09g033100 [Vigna angularis]|uniref:Uncharacterized protein n=1 Tax=Phaseolus angularis TaxID=3914 RepID=A0A0L9V9V2_PHAAN|nr:uncharacterized protein HKW66_Vig0094320 [Vigna angularis]KOM51672.1 hypothetical protein LR48_Vigan09g033100 [Vigna angularis]
MRSNFGIESSNPDQVRTAFDPSLENNSRLSNTDVSNPGTLPEEIALTGCLNHLEQPSTHSAEANNGGQICYGDFNFMQTIQKGGIQQCSSHGGAVNFELPPLPGEVEAPATSPSNRTVIVKRENQSHQMVVSSSSDHLVQANASTSKNLQESNQGARDTKNPSRSHYPYSRKSSTSKPKRDLRSNSPHLSNPNFSVPSEV